MWNSEDKHEFSSTVPMRVYRALTRHPSCAGVASPAITDAIAERASSRESVRPEATIPRASRASNEVLQHAHPVDGQHRLWVKLHGLERKRPMPQAHHHAVL